MANFWPRKITFQDLLVSSLAAFIAGFLGSLLILTITFLSSGALDIVGVLKSTGIGAMEVGSIFPLIMSLITLLWTSITMFLTYMILHMVSPERYKKNTIILGQIALFGMLLYILITPIYILLWIFSPSYLMLLFIAHTLIVIFGTNIILEVMNNYRHILIGIYGSFVGLFVSTILTILIFSFFSSGSAKLFSLVVLLPIINFSVIFFKQIFELLYYQFHLFTNRDPLWDIFYQMEMEEQTAMKLEEEKNLI